MFEAIDLRKLSQIKAGDRAVVSAYLSDNQALERLGKRQRQLRAMLSDHPDEQEHFDHAMQMIRDLLEDNPIGERGVAVFACWGLDFIEGYPVEVRLPDLLRVGATPYIRPLAELQDEYENFLIVAADNEVARIIHVTSDQAVDEDRVRGDVKNHVRKGGWSQQRYERRRDNQLKHYASEIAERLEELVRGERFDRIVLVGSDETLNEIERELPRQVAEHVAGRQEVNLNAGDDAVWEAAYGLYWREERRSEQELWQTIREEHFADGRAAAGAEDVLAALQQGRAQAVLVDRTCELKGTKCRQCEIASTSDSGPCPHCQHDDVFPIDLLNEIAALAERTSAEVDFTDPITGLKEVGGVAALLRY